MDEQKKGNSSLLSKKISRFIQYFFIISLFVTITITTIGYYSTQTILKNGVLKRQSSLAELAHKKLQFNTEGIKARASELAKNDSVRILSEKINTGNCSKLKSYKECEFTHELSSLLAKSTEDPNAGVTTIDIIDLKGITIASSKLEHIGGNIAHHSLKLEDFEETNSTETTFYTELISIEKEFGGAPIINFVTPIYSFNSNHIVGALIIHTNPHWISNSIDEVISSDAIASVVNSQRLLLASTEKNLNIVRKQASEIPPIQMCFNTNKNYIGSYFNNAGERVIGASSCKPSLFGVLIVEISEERAFAEINKFRNNALILIVIILFAIIMYIMFLDDHALRVLKSTIPTTLSSMTTTVMVMILIMTLAGVVSYLTTESIKNYIQNYETDIVITIAQNESEKIAPFAPPALWMSSDSQKAFSDFGSHVLKSYSRIRAVKLYFPDGTLVWSSLSNTKLGTKENSQIAKVIQDGSLIAEASISTLSELKVNNLLEIFSPIKDKRDNVIAVAEVYLDTDDTVSYVRKFQLTLWTTVFFALICIFLFIRGVFYRQDKKIIEQASELQAIVDHSPNGIFTVDKNGKITSVNKRMSELLAERTGRILGSNIFKDWRTNFNDVTSEIHQAFNGINFEKEVEMNTKGNKKLFVHYHGTPIIGLNKETTEKVLLTVEDITKKKELEKKLSTYTSNLEDIINMRTSDLNEKITSLEKFEKITIDREVRMLEMKKQIEKMRIKLESIGVNTRNADYWKNF